MSKYRIRVSKSSRERERKKLNYESLSHPNESDTRHAAYFVKYFEVGLRNVHKYWQLTSNIRHFDAVRAYFWPVKYCNDLTESFSLRRQITDVRIDVGLIHQAYFIIIITLFAPEPQAYIGCVNKKSDFNVYDRNKWPKTKIQQDKKDGRSSSSSNGLPHKGKTQHVHCRLIASYFFFPCRNPAEMSRR